MTLLKILFLVLIVGLLQLFILELSEKNGGILQSVRSTIK